MAGGFSTGVRLSNLNDFIAPSQSCVVMNTSAQGLPAVMLPTFKQTKGDPKPGEPVKVSLHDCLACSGCVTTAESVMLEQQSVGELLQQLQSALGEGAPSSRRVVVSVSPQSRAALAAHFQITPLQALRKLTTFLRSLGVWAVLDTSASRDVALVEVCREFVERYRATHPAPGAATATATTGGDAGPSGAPQGSLPHSASETSTASAPGAFAAPSSLSPSPSQSPSLSPSPSFTAPVTPAGAGAPSTFPWAEQHCQEHWQQQPPGGGGQFPAQDREGDAMDVEMEDGDEGAAWSQGRTSSCCQASSSGRSHLPAQSHSHGGRHSHSHTHSHSHSLSQSFSFSSSHSVGHSQGDSGTQLWQETSFRLSQQQMRSSQPQLSPHSPGQLSPLPVSPRPGASASSDAPTASPLPLLSSACPGWVCYAEKRHGEQILGHMSRVKSPQQIMGSLLKRTALGASFLALPPEDIYHVTIMPCYDKKLEALRDDFTIPPARGAPATAARGHPDSTGGGPLFGAGGVHGHAGGGPLGSSSSEAPGEALREVDCVLTSGELFSLLQERCPDFMALEEAPLLPALVSMDHEGRLQGVPGGSGSYAETVVRFAARELFGIHLGPGPLPWRQLRNADMREFCVQVNGQDVLRVACAYGFHNVQNIVRRAKAGKLDYHFVEVMACPGGCLSGGGQPKPRPGQSLKSHLQDLEAHYLQQVHIQDPFNSPLVNQLFLHAGMDAATREAVLHTSYHSHTEQAVSASAVTLTPASLANW